MAGWHHPRVDDVQSYADGVRAEHRPLFDRARRLADEVAPGATVKISYGMPTWAAGKRKLSLGVWQHGLSVYGWGENRDGGFLGRHPELRTSKGTIRITPAQADLLDDDELRSLFRAVLAP